jgi:hypothetical protein
VSAKLQCRQIQSNVRRIVATSTPVPGSRPSAPVIEGWSRAQRGSVKLSGAVSAKR